jgi:glycosyltransferase involved in cell wall biosynthesis
MPSRLRRVSIDLTPVQPGGDNGGAKVVARALIQQFSVLAPNTEFRLMTTAANHADLADLDAANVGRDCVDVAPTPMPATHGALAGARLAARVLVDSLVPAGARSRVKDRVWTIVKRQQRAAVARATLADLHFAPFTAPFFFDPRVPLVAIVHDLQFLDYPEFFEERQRQDRLQHFHDACARADRLICVSEFVRQTVLAHSQLSPDAIRTIHSTVLHATQPNPLAASVTRQVLAGLGIGSARFLLYPANPWPHKNHRVLLEAFADYLRANPGSDLALVCTGAPGPGADEIRALGQRLLPADRFAFAGFLAEPEFAALLQKCRAVIFPSLYEGFGLPVLEAMACDRPVLCSNAASLPEVAGDAAILFEPRDPTAIAAAIERLESFPELEASLAQRGRQRLARFGSPREMAAKYLDAFEQVVTARAA